MVIYKIQNNINGKIYIGQTQNALSRRIASHIGDNKFPIARALNKYGLESFTISVIDEADTKEILNEKEKYWIRFFNCKIPYGYNLTDGGSGATGYQHSAEWKQNASQKFSGDLNPMKRPEIVEKVRVANKGRVHSDETKARQSAASKGKPKSAEHRQHIAEGLQGHAVSVSSRKKISVARKGTKNSAESNRKRSITQTGRPHLSVEGKERLSELRFGKPRTEKDKQAMRHPKSPEGRANIAASNRRRAEMKKLNKS